MIAWLTSSFVAIGVRLDSDLVRLLKSKCQHDLTSWPFRKPHVQHHSQGILSPHMLLLWHSSDIWRPERFQRALAWWVLALKSTGMLRQRKKQKGIMQASWSQGTLHSSMLPLTDMNKRNQLDLLGCYPRDFHRRKGKSKSKHLEKTK